MCAHLQYELVRVCALSHICVSGQACMDRSVSTVQCVQRSFGVVCVTQPFLVVLVEGTLPQGLAVFTVPYGLLWDRYHSCEWLW